MEDDPVLAGTLYVVGHVRLYHGKQTELPKRYVSRQRLCLRGTTDYWVNDALGKPFFRVDRPIDQGMLEALRSDIVPQLLRDVPRQPSPEELQANPHRCRFVLIFDREGYSPVFIKEMWQTHRIACITYHKFPKEAWPVGEFAETQAEVDSQIQSVQSKLNRKPVEFAAHTIRPQLFAGEIATNLGDRLKISRLISVGKIQDIEVENDETHRTRNGRTETVDNNESIMIIGNRLPAMRNTGFSVLGAQQILLGQPVTSHNDRDSVPE